MATKVPAGSDPPAMPMDALLKDLAAKNSLLETIDVGISASIPRIEKLLRKCVSVRIAVRTGWGSDEENTAEYLVFGKTRGHWMLAIEDVNADDHDSLRNRTPLSSSSRADRARIFAGGHIEELIREAYRRIEVEIEERKPALAAIDRLRALEEIVGDVDENPSYSSGGPTDDIPF